MEGMTQVARKSFLLEGEKKKGACMSKVTITANDILETLSIRCMHWLIQAVSTHSETIQQAEFIVHSSLFYYIYKKEEGTSIILIRGDIHYTH